MQPSKSPNIIQTTNLPSLIDLINNIDSTQRLRFSAVLYPDDDLYIKVRENSSNIDMLKDICTKNFPSIMETLNVPSKQGLSKEQFRALLLHQIGIERSINVYYSLNFLYHRGCGADPEVEYIGYRDGSGEGGIVRNLIAEPSDFTKRFSWISFQSVRLSENIDEAKKAINLFCDNGYVPVKLSLWDPGGNSYTFEDGELNRFEDYELIEGKTIKFN